MKILLVIGSLGAGGAERVMSILANNLTLDFEVELISISDKPSFYEINNKVKLHYLGLQAEASTPLSALKNNFIRLRAIKKLIILSKPDLLISFLPDSNVLAIIASLISKHVPVIISERSNPLLDITVNRFWKVLRRLSYSWADALVVQSDPVKEHFSKFVNRIEIIPNPLVLKDITRNNKNIILSVGRFTKEKQTDHIIRAVSKLENDWILNLIGDGPLKNDLITLAAELKIQHKINFIGQVRDVEKYYQEASIFVLSSRYEGYPNALCEAMGHGVACITYDNGNDIIKDGYNGIIVPAQNEVILLEKIIELCRNEKSRDFLAKNALKINDKLNVNVIMQLWKNLIYEFV